MNASRADARPITEAALQFHLAVVEAGLSQIVRLDLDAPLFAYEIDSDVKARAELFDGKLVGDQRQDPTGIVINAIMDRYMDRYKDKALADIERGFRVKARSKLLRGTIVCPTGSAPIRLAFSYWFCIDSGPTTSSALPSSRRFVVWKPSVASKITGSSPQENPFRESTLHPTNKNSPRILRVVAILNAKIRNLGAHYFNIES